MNCKEQIEIDLKAHFDKKSSGLFQFTGWECQNPVRGLGGPLSILEGLGRFLSFMGEFREGLDRVHLS